ncbi:hypothetical protein K402DRAFT_417684 [Aulographum hederae CBS 113979]|uniref:Uncharacterized protein n=1 Tax=Aulographum hederae CBS 113979 TaxID=1176131 RepID=A0A6G1HB26_9PEZI|nr:hypothetical protein K402DRAFT_417684 [Aulographum hederae CBS 113979]
MAEQSKQERITSENRDRENEIRRAANKVDVTSDADYARNEQDAATQLRIIDAGFASAEEEIKMYLVSFIGASSVSKDVETLASELVDSLRASTVLTDDPDDVAGNMRGLAGREYVKGEGDDEDDEEVLKMLVVEISDNLKKCYQDTLSKLDNPNKFEPLPQDDAKWSDFQKSAAEAYLTGDKEARGN